ncbi:hypothetical protein [Dysgonomonas massiliensis]|uniref:hypothetical protein n=1 Tax=Dysgonomonas massiliensis TaxID=2040292 RepID=UPI000C79251C|nr:hypothetical protein [Dysgonomonas massiliensis]
MKKYQLIFMFAFAFMLMAIGLNAQNAAMQAQRVTQQHQQHAMMAHRAHMQMQRQFEHMNLMRMNMHVKKIDGKYKFNVVTADGDTVVARKRLRVHFSKPMSEIKIKTDDGERIFKPADTKEIFIKHKSDYIKGIPNDSIWIFNTFSSSDVKFYGMFPAIEMGYLGWFQTEGDSIRTITKDNMQELMQGYDKSLKALKKNKTGHAIYYYLKEEKKRSKSKD